MDKRQKRITSQFSSNFSDFLKHVRPTKPKRTSHSTPTVVVLQPIRERKPTMLIVVNEVALHCIETTEMLGLVGFLGI